MPLGYLEGFSRSGKLCASDVGGKSVSDRLLVIDYQLDFKFIAQELDSHGE